MFMVSGKKTKEKKRLSRRERKELGVGIRDVANGDIDTGKSGWIREAEHKRNQLQKGVIRDTEGKKRQREDNIVLCCFSLLYCIVSPWKK